jgi:phospholipid/cholesterol/gamma-HCH transport system substrate-binding protein
MNEQAMRFRLGVFVLAALILFAVLATLFGGLGTWFQRYDRYTVTLSDAAGVGPGTPVRRSGVRIGDVERVELDPDTGKVKVSLRVQSRYPLRRNDVAVLNRGLLGGDTSIDFVPRPPAPGAKAVDRTPVEPGTNFEGIAQTDIGTVLKQTSDLMPPAKDTLQDIRKSLAQFDKLTPVLSETLVALRDLAKSTNTFFPDVKKTNVAIQDTAKKWGQAGDGLDKFLRGNDEKLARAVDSFNETLKRVNQLFSDTNQRNLAATLQNVAKGTERLDSLTRTLEDVFKGTNQAVTRAEAVMANLQTATQPLAQRSDTILRNLDESTAKLNCALGEVNGLLRLVGRGDGTVQRLLSDPSLYNNLNQAACMVTRMLPKVDRALQDLEIFADKLARHPEAIGLGGVVNPGSGLKQAPSSWQRPPGH